MKKNKKFKTKGRDDSKSSPFEDRKKFCPFSQKNSPVIDYKMLNYYLGILVKKVKLYLVELVMYQDQSRKTLQKQLKELDF